MKTERIKSKKQSAISNIIDVYMVLNGQQLSGPQYDSIEITYKKEIEAIKTILNNLRIR